MQNDFILGITKGNANNSIIIAPLWFGSVMSYIDITAVQYLDYKENWHAESLMQGLLVPVSFIVYRRLLEEQQQESNTFTSFFLLHKSDVAVSFSLYLRNGATPPSIFIENFGA